MSRNSIVDFWGLLGTRRARPHLHAIHDRRRAGRQRFGRFLDLDQTHPAVGGDGKFLVVAKPRDIDVRGIGHFDQHGPLARLQGLAIDLDGDQIRTHHFSLGGFARQALGHAAAMLDIVLELMMEMFDETSHGHRGGIP